MATSIPPDSMSPVLLMLMVTPALLVPGAAAKATDVGVATSLAARRMLAVMGTASVTPPWEITTASPLAGPTAKGENSIITVQLAPAASVPLQVEDGSRVRSGPCTPVTRPVRSLLAVTATSSSIT